MTAPLLVAQYFKKEEDIIDFFVHLIKRENFIFTLGPEEQRRNLLAILQSRNVSLAKTIENLLENYLGESPCEVENLLPHLIFINKGAEEADKIKCVICQESPSTQGPFIKGPAHCPCTLCRNCNNEAMGIFKDDYGSKDLLCFGCRKPVTRSYLKASQFLAKNKEVFSTKDVTQIIRQIYKRKSAKIPGFQFCKTADCVGGSVVKDDSSYWYTCPLCKKESHFLGKNKDGQDLLEKNSLEGLLKWGRQCPPEIWPTDPSHPDYLKGRFRPCYYCGKMTERIDGCNKMKCPEGAKFWDWNFGLEGPDGNFDRSEMMYEPLHSPRF